MRLSELQARDRVLLGTGILSRPAEGYMSAVELSYLNTSHKLRGILCDPMFNVFYLVKAPHLSREGVQPWLQMGKSYLLQG